MCGFLVYSALDIFSASNLIISAECKALLAYSCVGPMLTTDHMCFNLLLLFCSMKQTMFLFYAFNNRLLFTSIQLFHQIYSLMAKSLMTKFNC